MNQGRPGLTRLMMLNSLLVGLRGQAGMQAEIIALRHQLTVLQRSQKSRRPVLTRMDCCLWVWLSRVWSAWHSALIIVKPETVINWHRQGFRWYWTWKVRHGRSGRVVGEFHISPESGHFHVLLRLPMRDLFVLLVHLTATLFR